MAELDDKELVLPTLGLSIEAVTTWQPMVKKTGTVFVKRLEQHFTVLTDSGPVSAPAGSYVAHDPISGHFWPVAASYLELHYRTATQAEVSATADLAEKADHQYPAT